MNGHFTRAFISRQKCICWNVTSFVFEFGFGLSNKILLCRFCVAQHAYIIHIWWSLFKYNFLHSHAAQSQFLMILSLWWSTLKNLLVDHVLYYIKGNNLDHENRLDIIVFWKCIERSEISLPYYVPKCILNHSTNMIVVSYSSQNVKLIRQLFI